MVEKRIIESYCSYIKRCGDINKSAKFKYIYFNLNYYGNNKQGISLNINQLKKSCYWESVYKYQICRYINRGSLNHVTTNHHYNYHPNVSRRTINRMVLFL